MTRRFRASRQRDDGAAAVEFAIVSTLLLMILFGILQYGFLFFQILTAQHAVEEAADLARTGAIRDTSGNNRACDEWRLAVRDSTNLLGAQWQRSSWMPLAASGTGPLEIDDRIRVAVVWEPVRIAGGLIPAPGTGTRETTVTTGITRTGIIGEEREYTPPNYGCPDPGPDAPPLPPPTPPITMTPTPAPG